MAEDYKYYELPDGVETPKLSVHARMVWPSFRECLRSLLRFRCPRRRRIPGMFEWDRAHMRRLSPADEKKWRGFDRETRGKG